MDQFVGDVSQPPPQADAIGGGRRPTPLVIEAGHPIEEPSPGEVEEADQVVANACHGSPT